MSIKAKFEAALAADKNYDKLDEAYDKASLAISKASTDRKTAMQDLVEELGIETGVIHFKTEDDKIYSVHIRDYCFEYFDDVTPTKVVEVELPKTDPEIAKK